MKEYLIDLTKNSRSFGEFLGNLIWLSYIDPGYRKLVDSIVKYWGPTTNDPFALEELMLDLMRRFTDYTDNLNHYWKVVEANDMSALIAGDPFSPDSFYAPDYDAAREHCIVVLRIKIESLL